MTMTTLTLVDIPDLSAGHSHELEVQDIEESPVRPECRCMLAAFGKCPTQSGPARDSW
jgi:hypothetical protein